MPRTHPPYPPEFRAEAVRLARGSDRSIPALAADLGVSSEALRHWLRQADADVGRGQPGELTTDERDELRRLRREVKGLQQERETLRTAAASCAHDALCAGTGSPTRSGPRTPSPSSAGSCGCRGPVTTPGRAVGRRPAPGPTRTSPRRSPPRMPVAGRPTGDASPQHRGSSVKLVHQVPK